MLLVLGMVGGEKVICVLGGKLCKAAKKELPVESLYFSFS